MRQSLWTIFMGFLCMMKLSAQSDTTAWTPERWQVIPAETDSLFLDSLPVITESLQFFQKDSTEIFPGYQLFQKPVSYIKFDRPTTDSLLVNYTILNLPLNQVFQHKDTSLILPDFTARPDQDLYEAEPEEEAFTPFQGLNSTGSISRGVSVGNNQDAVLNSNLNLQLSGNLGQNTEIRASITDNNIPVQSGGYTQQLREFDRVYIELENPDFGMLRAGDYNMTSIDNYFLKFDKRISGAGVFSDIALREAKVPLQLQGGIARGRFARNRFRGQEGNQGPYKLSGASGEQFIIIISGSERVYINGVLQKRGQQNDYVMDYNAGEITFTTLRPITKESRIVVEFQYTEQNYLRSIAFGNTGFVSENVKTEVHFYSEQDSKNQSLLRDLSDEEERVLSQVGDNLDQAVVPAISPTAFDDDLVLYELRDSLGHDSVLVYSTDSTRQLYQASFTHLGSNKGNYVVAQNDANGRVFRWVPPVNGQPQGSYEPVRQLSAPNQLQVLAVESQARLGEKNLLNVELAASKNDLNLFSDQDEANDYGVAGKFNFERKQEVAGGEMVAALNHEFNQDEFRTIERIRRIEFARDWNLPLNYDEGLQMSGLALSFTKDTARIDYSIDYLSLDGYSGLKNSLGLRFRDRSNTGRLRASWVSTSDSIGTTDFLREQGEFTHFLTPGFWAGIRSEGEWNKRQVHGTDTLRRSSYNFLEYSLFTGFGDTTENFTEFHFLERWDDTARFGRYMQFSKVNAYGVSTNVKTGFNSEFRGRANVRSLKVLQPEERQLQQTVTMRLNYLQRLFQNSITSTTFYETGSGTEPKRSYSYIEVPAGRGTYTHTDYNDNGIKELGEFETAPTPDLATYVRVFTPSNEFLRTSLQRFSQNLNINAPSSWQNSNDLRASLHRLSLLLNYQLDRKTLLTGTKNDINPFGEIEDDSLIVALNNNFRGTLFFNRSSSKFGMNYTYRNTDNHNLLSFGIEQRSVEEHTTDARFQFFDFWILKGQASLQDKQNFSANFTGRNYNIDQLMNLYSISYQPGDAIVMTGRYQWDRQTGTGETGNLLFAQTLGLDFTYNYPEKISVQASVNYIKNDFEGNANSPAGFEMLRELRPGDNGTWSLVVQRNLKKNILLSLNYSGRISPDNPPIHTGNLEVKAFF